MGSRVNWSKSTVCHVLGSRCVSEHGGDLRGKGFQPLWGQEREEGADGEQHQQMIRRKPSPLPSDSWTSSLSERSETNLNAPMAQDDKNPESLRSGERFKTPSHWRRHRIQNVPPSPQLHSGQEGGWFECSAARLFQGGSPRGLAASYGS